MKKYEQTLISAIQSWTSDKIKSSAANWNQNDKNAIDYVKNRTHWIEEGVLLVDNLTREQYEKGKAPSCNFIPGEKYKVIFNGKVYDNLICYYGDGCNVIASEDKGQPFYIDDDGGDALYIETDENWTISIYGNVIHKLDSKYLDLPTNIATTDDVDSAKLEALNADLNKMDKNNPIGTGSFSMGRKAGTTVGNYSHAEGYNTTASGNYSHAEGSNTTASGHHSHAEGEKNIASESCSHVEGYDNSATGYCSHVEGEKNIASNNQAHAEGYKTIASGYVTHTEGWGTVAEHLLMSVSGQYNIYNQGDYAVKISGQVNRYVNSEYYYADEYQITASGNFKLVNPVKGYTTTQEVLGKYTLDLERDSMVSSKIYYVNKAGSSNNSYVATQYYNELRANTKGEYIRVVGNGMSDTERSNAHTLDWQGNAWYAGDVYVGSTSGTNKDEGSKKLVTQEYVDIRVPAWTEADEGKILKIVNGVPTWTNISITSTDDDDGNVVIS